MAGHSHYPLRKDPAIERWALMRETTNVHFRWTPRTIGISLLWCGVVPVALYEFIISRQVRKA